MLAAVVTEGYLDIVSVLFWQGFVLLLQIVLQKQACALPYLTDTAISLWQG